MADQPNPADFSVNDKADEYEVTITVTGTVRTTIKADSLEDAQAKADAMCDDDGVGDGMDVDEARVDRVRKSRPMYYVTREGQQMQVTHLEPGDQPRLPNKYGF